MTAPISCWSVIPAGPRTASCLPAPPAADAAGKVVDSTVGLGIAEGEVAATRDPQPASTRTERRATARRMPAGSVPVPGVTRHRIRLQVTFPPPTSRRAGPSPFQRSLLSGHAARGDYP